MALATGVLVTVAMFGGVVAQAPLAALADAVSWRMALKIDAAFGLLIVAIIFFTVRDYPKGAGKACHHEQDEALHLTFWKQRLKPMML